MKIFSPFFICQFDMVFIGFKSIAVNCNLTVVESTVLVALLDFKIYTYPICFEMQNQQVEGDKLGETNESS